MSLKKVKIQIDLEFTMLLSDHMDENDIKEYMITCVNGGLDDGYQYNITKLETNVKED